MYGFLTNAKEEEHNTEVLMMSQIKAVTGSSSKEGLENETDQDLSDLQIGLPKQSKAEYNIGSSHTHTHNLLLSKHERTN